MPKIERAEFVRWMDSPTGPLTLACSGGALTHLLFGRHGVETEPNELLLSAASQLEEYFSGRRRTFDLPLNPQGTDFQRRVWDELLKIPYGQTAAYAEIARRIDRPRACRAVGQANHVNPISIIVPCHRVVGASGALTGYGGGLDVKRWLLDLERRFFAL